jgi:hypothetical protein
MNEEGCRYIAKLKISGIYIDYIEKTTGEVLLYKLNYPDASNGQKCIINLKNINNGDVLLSDNFIDDMRTINETTGEIKIQLNINGLNIKSQDEYFMGKVFEDLASSLWEREFPDIELNEDTLNQMDELMGDIIKYKCNEELPYIRSCRKYGAPFIMISEYMTCVRASVINKMLYDSDKANWVEYYSKDNLHNTSMKTTELCTNFQSNREFQRLREGVYLLAHKLENCMELKEKPEKILNELTELCKDHNNFVIFDTKTASEKERNFKTKVTEINNMIQKYLFDEFNPFVENHELWERDE